MRITVARLRRGILLLGGLLAAVLMGFFLYAHYRFRHIARDLPARLGANIQQTATGYTYSQSSKGHTLFTIHASKLVQYRKGGNATLHDVAITLYGPPGSSRVDKISGADFTYDPKQQEVRALGAVSLDLQGFGGGAQAAKKTIHVKTSGLVFSQKTGEADTSQHTEFAFPQASGSSTGAHYNSKTGVLTLDSDVEFTRAGPAAAVVHASHAEVARDSMQAFLLHPQMEYRAGKSSADTAIVVFRENGSVGSISAKGHVRMVTRDGAVVTAANSLTQLDDASQPKQAELSGGVNFVSRDANESMSGTANEATLTFGKDGLLKHATFRNTVSLVEEVFRPANDAKGTVSRALMASQLDVDFGPGPKGHRVAAREALATGNASVVLRTNPSKGPQESTTIRGDQLLATLTADGRAIRQLTGSGNTQIVSLAKDGSTNTSAGDRLLVTFAAQKRARSKAGAKKASQTAGPMEIASAAQDGHVILTQRPKRGPGTQAAPAMTAWAEHAEYQAAQQAIRLTGNPRLEDGALQLAAGLIDYQRDTGDASALGGVKATYTDKAQGAPTLGGEGPVHITADHAALHHATNASAFYGANGVDARMWQGGDSISAPVLELTRKPATLKAHGAPGSAGEAVEANLTSSSPVKSGAKGQPAAMRVRSRTLFYSDADRRAEFRSDVTARDAAGLIRADEAEVYLTPAPEKGAAHAKGASRLERVVATGGVELTQPGRKGFGEKLVYTAKDGRYVLTGTPGKPPRIEDAAKGTTTGSTLIFNSQDDSVVVSGGQSRAVTETRTPK